MSRMLRIGFLGVMIGLVPSVAHAAGMPDLIGANVGESLGMSLNEFLEKVAAINTFLHILLLIVLQFCQYLLQADFFTNEAMMSAMNNVWKLSRDIMNVIFAVMLVFVAFYTIVTANKKFVTEKLQTFVMAVVLVNFSWFFPRVVIDVSNILTATVYTVPQYMGAGTCQVRNAETGALEDCKVITDVQILDGNPAKPDANGQQFCPGGTTSDTCVCVTDVGCYKMDDYNTIASAGTTGVGHVMLNGLVVNFARVLTMIKIPNQAPGAAGAIGPGKVSMNILMAIGVALCVQLAVLLPLIGLVIGLLVRIVTIWICIAFMPFTFLGFVMNGKLGTNVFGFEYDVWDEFQKAVFLPVFVALPITIGFIMILTVQTIPEPAPLVAGGLNFGQPILFGVRSWWALLWMMAAIAILYTGAFAALGKSKITAKFTDKIKGFGDNVFDAASQIPLMTPLPIPGMNVGTLFSAAKMVPGAMRETAKGMNGKSFMQNLTANFTNARNTAPVNNVAVNASVEALKNNDQNTDKIVTALRDLRNHNMTGAEFINQMKPLLVGIKDLPNLEVKDILSHLDSIAAQNTTGNDNQVKIKGESNTIKELIQRNNNNPIR